MASKPTEKLLNLIRLCHCNIYHNNISLITMRLYFIPVSLVRLSLAIQNVGSMWSNKNFYIQLVRV